DAKQTLTTTLTFDWSSDGENVSISIPDQATTVNWEDGLGNTEVINFDNVNKEAITFTATEDGFRALNLHLASLFIGKNDSGSSDMPAVMANFIQLGQYGFEANFSGIGFDDYWEEGERPYNLEGLESFVSLFDVTSDQVKMSATDVEVSEGDGEARVVVKLSQPLDYDFTVSYTTKAGDQYSVLPPATAGEDYQAVSGAITFLAGQTEQVIVVPIIFDGIEELDVESFIISFPDFYAFREDDGTTYSYSNRPDNWQELAQVSSYQGVSLTHGLNGTTVTINDTTIATTDNTGILDDADQDGEYLVTVRVTEGENFQDYEVL
ncbi:uncharacterized protein METZ01_LOCUS350129, partial [marine metagenome]